MVERIPDLPANVLGFTATGTVTASDYESVRRSRKPSAGSASKASHGSFATLRSAFHTCSLAGDDQSELHAGREHIDPFDCAGAGSASDRLSLWPDEPAKRLGESIANASKGPKSFHFTAFNRRRIRKAPMYSLRVAWKNGTALVRVIADGDHVVEVLAVEFPNVLGAVA